MKTHKKVLKDVINGKLSDGVSSENYDQIEEFIEMYNQGLIRAIDASGDTGVNFLEPMITISGRHYFESLCKPKPRWWQRFDYVMMFITAAIAFLSFLASIKVFDFQ